MYFKELLNVTFIKTYLKDLFKTNIRIHIKIIN